MNTMLLLKENALLTFVRKAFSISSIGYTISRKIFGPRHEMVLAVPKDF